MKFHAAILTPLALVLASSGISADPNPYDDVQTATGPTFVEVHDVAAVGLAACFADPTFPFLNCDPSPGALQGFRPAKFDVSDWNSDPARQDTREVRVWVESNPFSSGLCAVQCAFSVLACSDFDDDRSCTNEDDVALARSGEPFVGDGTPCESDDKGCGDPSDAETHLCVRADPGGAIFGGYDHLLVHTGIYVEEPLFGNDGQEGVDFDVDFFNVYVEYGDWGCTPSDPGVPVHVTHLELDR